MEPSPPAPESPTPLPRLPSLGSSAYTSVQSRAVCWDVGSTMLKGQCALKNARNTTAPVNSLPNELFVEIFLLALPRPLGNCGDTRSDLRAFASWAPLMLVCRHWRDVILSTPRLWRVIKVGKDLKWMGLAVSRSQNAMLDVSIRIDTPIIATYPILLPVAKRIAVLNFDNVYVHQLAAALRLVDSAQSSLIKLCLTRPLGERDASSSWRRALSNVTFHCVWTFSPQRFPVMTALTIEGVRVSLRDPQAFISRLRVLDVRKCLLLCDPPIFTLSTFLGILASCASLEEARLCGVLSQFHDDQPAKSAQRSRIVSIAKLRKLTIEDKVGVVSSFISSLHIPLNVHVRLVGEVKSLSDNSPGLFLPVLPLNRRQTLPVLDSVRSLSLDVNRGRRQFEVHALSNGGGGVEFGVYLTEDRRRDVLIPRAVDEVLHLFSDVPITSFTLAAYMVDDIEEAEWARLFAGFRALESFTLSSMGVDALRVFDALAQSQPGEDGDRVVCPKLRKLYVNGPFWSDDTLDCIVKCLATRARGNATALEKLELELSFDSFKDFEETKSTFLREIGAVFAGETEFGYDLIHEESIAR